MNIVFDHQIFALQNVGGISRYFVEIAKRLPGRSSNIATTVLAPVHINSYLAESNVHTIGKKIIEFSGKHHLLPHINRAASKLYLNKARTDIFHETYYTDYLQTVRSPRLLTVFDMIHEKFPESFKGPDLAIPKKKSIAVSRADHIIAISNATKNDLITYLDVSEEKISVIPLASSIISSATHEKQSITTRPYLLYVGLRQGVKNHISLLKAYSLSKTLRDNIDLLCVGGGPFTRSELQTINNENLQGKVHQQQADDKNLSSLYANAVLFVYPSLYEGFGLPLLEAMRCGCPVVCSNTSSMPEIAGEAAVYFNPYNEEEIRTKIEEVVFSDDSLERLRRLGYKRHKQFTWESCVEQTAKLYGSML